MKGSIFSARLASANWQFLRRFGINGQQPLLGRWDPRDKPAETLLEQGYYW